VQQGAPRSLPLGATSDAASSAFDIFFFSYGVFVCWGAVESGVAAVRREVVAFETKPLEEDEVSASYRPPTLGQERDREPAPPTVLPPPL